MRCRLRNKGSLALALQVCGIFLRTACPAGAASDPNPTQLHARRWVSDDPRVLRAGLCLGRCKRQVMAGTFPVVDQFRPVECAGSSISLAQDYKPSGEIWRVTARDQQFTFG